MRMGPVELRMMRGWPLKRQKTEPARAVPRKLSITPCQGTKKLTAAHRKLQRCSRSRLIGATGANANASSTWTGRATGKKLHSNSHTFRRRTTRMSYAAACVNITKKNNYLDVSNQRKQ